MISSNELIQSKNRYIQLKSELEGVSVSLKESVESLAMAAKGINNSYLIDNESADYNKISQLKEENVDILNEAERSKTLIDAKIRELESQVKKALAFEAEQKRLEAEELARKREETNLPVSLSPNKHTY